MLDNPWLLVGLPIVNAIMMGAIGLTLEVRDFQAVVRSPRAVGVGLAAHYLFLPLLGFAIGTLFTHSVDFAVGFVLLAACPSASVSNVVTLLARGNVALAVTLTAISALVTLVSVPFLVNLAAWWFGGSTHEIHLPVARTVLQLAALVLAPVVIGMTVRRHAPEFARRAEPWITRLSAAALLAVIITFVATQGPFVRRSVAELGPAALTMSCLGVAGGFLLAWVARLQLPDRITIGIEVGVQNCMLALLIGLTMLRSIEISMPVAVYGLLMFLPAAALIGLSRVYGVGNHRRSS